MSDKGIVYMIHFETRFGHAGHYTGTTKRSLEERLREHQMGTQCRGARLLEVCNEHGIRWDVVRTWQTGGHDLERRIKRRGAVRLCPVCNPEHYSPEYGGCNEITA